MSAARVPVIGIVGGIGSGKSALAGALKDYFQCALLDADQVGHVVLEQTEVIAELQAAFGPDILDSQGRIVRSRLACRVFGTGEQEVAARARLEAIVHPRIRASLQEQLITHDRRGDCQLILLDAALLFEAGWDQVCDAVIYLDVPDEVRRARVAERGWSVIELQRRESSQMSLLEKRQRADLVLDNSQNLQAAAATAADWLQRRFSIPLSGVSAPCGSH